MRRKLRRLAIAFGLTGVAAATLATGALAIEKPPELGEIHGLSLGQKADEMKIDGFGEFACGSNGGPPRLAIEDWTEFKKCRPEPNGLHEVSVRFDDQDEYIAKAIDDQLYMSGKRGTRVAGHPVLLSLLFDDSGIVKAIRFITDPRDDPTARRMAFMLGRSVKEHYDPDGWTCTDTPPAPGETPVGGVFIKQHCEKTDDVRRILIDTRFLRRPGQNAIDPVTREYTTGQYESSTRVEMWDPTFKKP